jgi:hypothetical protein
LKDYVARPGRESALGHLAVAQKIQESVSSFSAELKDYVARPGRESALGRLAAAQKIQENFYFTLARHGCHAMSASRPPSGRHSPASASGRRSPATPRSLPLSAEERLLRLLDLDDRHDTDSENEFSLLNAPSVSGSISRSTTRGMTARSAVLSEGTSPVPVSATPVRTGGRNCGEGGVGGIGGVGGGGERPATRASAKGARPVITAKADSSPKIYTLKNADKPQGCIFSLNR